ncbi:thyrotropin-releasing hormone receptor [Plakobranchus ocellatus]|uniref:Thyrotropin-releasing hormone receptor n=1 Tax=Plakobranchus ocellatus TaxID=259542 RepID=A0AAV4BIE7_9GAST|nr:thyrotropin-releasing hormone receptor [Plakobranchus ocellatus]
MDLEDAIASASNRTSNSPDGQDDLGSGHSYFGTYLVVKGDFTNNKLMAPVSHIFFNTTANWVLILICLERFIAVRYPLKKAYLFTKRRSFMGAAILVLVMFTVTMTSLGVVRHRVKKKSICSTRLRFEWFYKHIWTYLNLALHLILPFFLIAILSAFIIYGLQKSRKHRMSLIRKSESHPEFGEMTNILKDGAGRSNSGSESNPQNSRPPSSSYGNPQDSRPPSSNYGNPQNSRPSSSSYGNPQDSRPPSSSYIYQQNSRPPSGSYSNPRYSHSSSTPITPTALHNKKMLDDTARVERTITLMLIVAAVIFLVLSLPQCLLHLVSAFHTKPADHTVQKAQWRLYHMIAFLLLDSSHAINFFLYFFTAKRFRTQLYCLLTDTALCCSGRITQKGRSVVVPCSYNMDSRTSSKCAIFASTHSTASTEDILNEKRKSKINFPPGLRENGNAVKPDQKKIKRLSREEQKEKEKE